MFWYVTFDWLVKYNVMIVNLQTIVTPQVFIKDKYLN
jgi:hypothetical protein